MVATLPSARFETDFLEVRRLVVRAGDDVNGIDADGRTPLHVAASWSLCSAAKALMIFGDGDLDFDAPTNDRETAEDLALLDSDGDDEIVRLLQQRCLSPEDEMLWSKYARDRVVDLDEKRSELTDEDGNMEDLFFEALDDLEAMSC